MRDVMGNMEELAGEFAFHDMGGELEILSVEPAAQYPGKANDTHAPLVREILSAEVKALPARHVA